jgi:HEAT repeat protein
MSPTATLESLLASGSWDAVEEAQRQGVSALPTVQTYAKSKNSASRQIAMACASRIGGEQAAQMLTAGLADADINVQLTAAKELDSGKFPSASLAILEHLARGKDDLVREFLALDAGYIPGDRTIAVLRPLAAGQGGLATNARMALAKLKDGWARDLLVKDLSSPLARTRYEALDQLRYVDDQQFVSNAKKLLDDREPARRIGTARNPRFRRVCDQAVDTLAFLLKLHPSFPVAPEKIYTPEQLSQFRQLVG